MHAFANQEYFYHYLVTINYRVFPSICYDQQLKELHLLLSMCNIFLFFMVIILRLIFYLFVLVFLTFLKSQKNSLFCTKKFLRVRQ